MSNDNPTGSSEPVDFDVEAYRRRVGVCIRFTPPGAPPCTQHYDHTGPCDWFDAAAVHAREVQS